MFNHRDISCLKMKFTFILPQLCDDKKITSKLFAFLNADKIISSLNKLKKNYKMLSLIKFRKLMLEKNYI